MLTHIHPKLPMQDKQETKNYYVGKLGFEQVGSDDYPDYMMMRKDDIEIHFFLFKEINPKENYGMVYIRVSGIEEFYQNLQNAHVEIHPNGNLQTKPWGVKEFALLDPTSNLLTFGEKV